MTDENRQRRIELIRENLRLRVERDALGEGNDTLACRVAIDRMRAQNSAEIDRLAAAAERTRERRMASARENLVSVWDDTLRRLAESDHKPAATDRCRTPEGLCDGSCAEPPGMERVDAFASETRGRIQSVIAMLPKCDDEAEARLTRAMNAANPPRKGRPIVRGRRFIRTKDQFLADPAEVMRLAADGACVEVTGDDGKPAIVVYSAEPIEKKEG